MVAAGTGALEGFLRLAEHGYHLAPIKIRRQPDGRKRTTYFRDRGAGWGEIATTDPDRIRGWWDRYGSDLGFLIACAPSGIVVVDLDLKPAAEVDAVSWWSGEGLPIGSMRVDTPSGGQHLYFRQRKGSDGGPIANSTGAIAPGVDIRGAGGQYGGLVHAPGTMVLDGEPGEVYRMLDALVRADELDEIPEQVIERIPEPRRTRSERARDSAGGRSHQLSWISGEVKRLAGLVREMPPTEGAGFRYALMGTAMMAGRLAVAQGDERAKPEAFLRSLAEHVWGSVDADDERWIQTGLDDGEADPYTIEPEDTEDSTQETDPDAYQVKLDRKVNELRLIQDARDVLSLERSEPFRVLTAADFLASAPPSYLIEHMLPADGLATVFGPPGTAKSFLMLDVALALATGREWHGTAPERTVVHYVMAEGRAVNVLRTRAWLAHHDVDPGELDGWLRIVDRPIPLTDIGIRDYLPVVTAEQPGLIVLDTKNLMYEGKESAGDDIGAMLRILHRIRDAAGGACVCLIDHTGLTDETRVRGSNAQKGGMEIEIGVTQSGSVSTATVTRDKSGIPDPAPSWSYRLDPVESVPAPPGVMTPAVCVPVDDDERPAPRRGMHGDDDWQDVVLPLDVMNYEGPGASHIREVAQLVAHYGGIRSGIGLTKVAAYYREHHKGQNVTAATADKRVRRAWDALREMDRLEPVEGVTSPTGAHVWVVES